MLIDPPAKVKGGNRFPAGQQVRKTLVKAQVLQLPAVGYVLR